jgi:hypothetical protein
MYQLKIAIANKILELSSVNAESLKPKLREIQRFSDFADACESMMQRYPNIQSELLQMVDNDDFDTAKASRTVDLILQNQHDVSSPAAFIEANDPEMRIPYNTGDPESDDIHTVSEEISRYDEDALIGAEEKKRRMILILKIVGVVIVLVLLFFIIKNYWEIILVVAGIVLVAFIIWKIFLWRKSKKNN